MFLALFANLKFGILDLSFPKILECELVVFLLDLNIFVLPESVPCILRYVVSAIHVTL